MRSRNPRWPVGGAAPGGLSAGQTAAAEQGSPRIVPAERSAVPALFGRDSELALADSFLESASERFGVLLLEGEAGIGKTTLWREVARRAQERGIRVLAARPAEAETKLALSAVADLFAPVPAGAFAQLPGPQRRALEVALLRADAGTAPLDRRTLGTAVRSLLAELRAEGPLLVAIDDVHWLDGSSAAVLEFALRRLADVRLGWLLARRLPQPARLADDGLAPAGSLTRHRLRPLTLAALHHLLADRLDHPLSRPTLVRVHEASGGNPLFALEIAGELEPTAPVEAGARLPVPEGLRELLAGRIPRLPLDAREALLAVAALSHPTPEVVESASSAAGLAAAEETGLVRVDEGRVAFAHPLYASAVYDTASRARRGRMHRRLAQVVTNPEEQARHLGAATTAADEGVARRLEQAATLARSRGAWESAAELLGQAAGLTPPDRVNDGPRRLIAAAEHHVHAGERSRARALLEEVLAEPLSRALRAEALRLLAEISYHDETAAEAKRLFDEALRYADEPRLVATIELGLTYLSGHVADPPGGVLHAYRALERAEAAADGPLVGQALSYCAMYDYLCGRGVDWDKVEQSLTLEDPNRITPQLGRPSLLAALLLLYVGRHSEARERLTAIWTTASERGDESDLAFILVWLGWLETRSGNLGAAAALAEEAASVATLTGSESMYGQALAQRAFVHAHRGEVAETRRDCGDAAALLERFGIVWVGVWIAASIGLLELSLGNPQSAWQACERATAALEQQGIAEPTLAFFLPDALEALIAVGQLDRAEALLDGFERRGRELDRAWALATGGRCRGLLLAAGGDISGALAAMERALRDHKRLEMPFELARTQLAKGVVERRARRRARAKQSFERALEIFERVGARLWAERARQELDRVGLRRSSGDELTAAERRVAELAAKGLTNRQVADALYVSPKTVEANLTRVYRKLGIASRAELGARMAKQVQE
jgi:DNA-binding CsgD family transcriptional regulator